MNSTPAKRAIVLIDDEPGVLRALKLLLGALGHSVTDFGNPLDAVAHIRMAGAPIDVVMSDLRMPQLDGLGVLREIRTFNADLPFVLVSGHATEEDVSMAKSLGATAFLGKPFTPDQIRQVLTKI
jgi:CheY-like chemotaxis protein